MNSKHIDDCNLNPLGRCRGRCVVENSSKPAPSDGFGLTPMGMVAATMVGASILLIVSPARAHDALPSAAQPQGWSYPFSCCSGYDCREVADKAIGERPEGYVIKGTGEVITFTDARIKNSPDGVFHWCSVAGDNDGRTICLFVPPRGF